ncbi:tyrosine-type recombinase/integrase [Corynebacterium amycolatum]|uniref:tyrosine-type recombinase/integrase n=1 Tax=Corynebacterium amycolatum TaxID=43765 RepID=UPI00191D1F75|nr:tyrosine-type recombinase/integrase [Corynebacterium amycolatum]QQU97753.1 tyrosine-type recombinase/integrase [Corynebacterium amycolatum]
MASIKRYKKSRGYGWRVQYRAPDGSSRTKQGFATKDEAQAWAAQNTTSMRQGTWSPEQRRRQTVGELGASWLSMQTHLKPSTFKTTDSTWRVHVKPYWGPWRVGDIRRSDVQAWVSGFDAGASTVRKAHACLAQIIDVAVGDGTLSVNPARGVRLPRKPKAKKVYLTANQVKTLAKDSKRPELIWLLATTGLRWGEAAALRVRDVNVLKRRISVERNAVTVGSEVIIGTPKTHERRTVAVPKRVMRMLEPLLKDKLPDALLWPARDGGPLPTPSTPDWYYGNLERVMKADKKFPYVTPHGLRHVAAGLMVGSGASVKVVQSQLGHASAAMTLDTYADLFDDDLDAVADVMDEQLRGVV